VFICAIIHARELQWPAALPKQVQRYDVSIFRDWMKNTNVFILLPILNAGQLEFTRPDSPPPRGFVRHRPQPVIIHNTTGGTPTFGARLADHNRTIEELVHRLSETI